MLAHLVTANLAIKQEPFADNDRNSYCMPLQDATQQQAAENTIQASATNHSLYSQKTPASATWEGGVQPQSEGTVHQHQQYYQEWPREFISHSWNTASNPATVIVKREGRNINSSGVEGCNYQRRLQWPPVKIKREETGIPTQYTNCPVDTKFISVVQNRKAMALSLDSFIQFGGSPLSPGLAVPDNSQGILSDMYTDYSMPSGNTGPLFEGDLSKSCGDPGTEEWNFFKGWYDPSEQLSSSLTELPSDFGSLEQEWLTQPTSLPLTPDKQEGDVTFTSVSPVATPTPYTSSPTNAAAVYSALLSPDSSLPSTPLSSNYYSEEEELSNVLAIFEDDQHSSPFAPNEPLPIPSNPVSPYRSSQYHEAFSPSSFGTPSPLSSTDSVESIRDLLLKSESSSPNTSQPSSPQTCARTLEDSTTKAAGSSRKRKLPESDPSYQPGRSTTKRRLPQSVKKERKREQNKTAALRYRQRKKEEKTDIDVTRQKLEEKNTELKSTVNALSAEINYLKKLWQEVLSAKKRKQQQQQC